jgi:uncharacterized membrane protein YoaK (UPF0700 family)
VRQDTGRPGRGCHTIDHRYPLIAAAGIAMGIQSAAAHCVGVLGVATTYVTGTLTSLASRLADWLRAPSAGVPCSPGRHTSFGHPDLFPRDASVRWPSVALLLPIGIIAVVIVIAAIVYRRRQAPV